MRLTPRSHAQHTLDTGQFLRVFVDGQDVTEDAYLADDEEGFADLYLRNEAGYRYVTITDEGEVVANRRLTGKVEFRAQEATAAEISAAFLLTHDHTDSADNADLPQV